MFLLKAEKEGDQLDTPPRDTTIGWSVEYGKNDCDEREAKVARKLRKRLADRDIDAEIRRNDPNWHLTN